MENIQLIEGKNAVLVPTKKWKKVQNELARLRKKVNKAKVSLTPILKPDEFIFLLFTTNRIVKIFQMKSLVAFWRNLRTKCDAVNEKYYEIRTSAKPRGDRFHDPRRS